MDEGATLREAHRQATQLEDDIREATDAGALVNIHIEPLGARIPGAEEMKELARAVQEFLISLQPEYRELVDCHEVSVRSVEHKILVSCHCSMDGGLPITEVHDVTAALESRAKERFPQIFRLTVHPEPVEEELTPARSEHLRGKSDHGGKTFQHVARLGRIHESGEKNRPHQDECDQ